MVPSTALLLPSYFSFLSPMKPSHRWFFLDLPCGALPDLTHHLPWQLSETPLTGIAPLCCTALEASAEQNLEAHCELVISTTAGSYVKCSSRINQMQHTSALLLGLKKNKEKITRIHLTLYQIFQVKKLNCGQKTKQPLTSQSANLSQWALKKNLLWCFVI